MSALGILLRKELLDLVRDTRTLMFALVVPVLVYPLVLAGIGFGVQAGLQRLKNEPLIIAVCSDEALALLTAEPLPAHTTYERMSLAEAEQKLRDEKIGAVVSLEKGSRAEIQQGAQATVTILYTKRFDLSKEALERVKPVLEKLNTGFLQLRLAEKGLTADFGVPLLTQARDQDFDKNLGPVIAASFLPFALLVMMAAAAAYPAVDLTAGERERGTIETLLVAPVRPFEVMLAKFITVSAATLASALANLAAMAISFGLGVSFGPDAEQISLSFSALQIGVLLVAFVPTAFAVSAVFLTAVSAAKTSKEGQSIAGILSLLFMLPGMLAQSPGVELTTATALIPGVNVSLLIKAVVLGKIVPLHVALTVGSVLLFSGLALWAAARAFESENLQFGGTAGWLAVFGLKKQ